MALSADRPGPPERSDAERRRGMRRVVIVMPSAFTLGNLFFGFWAIVSAFNGNFYWAGWFIVFAGILDMLDGRVARLSNTGTRFGAELDSLIDVISFGVAPALLAYFLHFATAGRFAWVLCYIYVVAVALRLARYNVLAHGMPPSNWFTGLPSPSAGMTVATYYAFTQTDWYQSIANYIPLGRDSFVVLILLVSVLMVSNVKYPKFPPVGTRSLGAILGTLLIVGLLLGGIFAPSHILFPFGLLYILFGILRAAVLGLMEQRGGEPLVDVTAERPVIHPERRSRWGDRRHHRESNE